MTRSAEVTITEAELAHLCQLVELFRVGSPVAKLDRIVASVAAKRFLTRAVRAMPLSDAELAEVAARPGLAA